MKLNLHNVKRKAGMTLLELSVVILVLLTLIAVLFIGAQAYKKGADRAACVLNLRNIQQAVRTYANTNQVAAATATTPGGPVPVSAIYDATGSLYLKTPLCPTANAAYSSLGTNPPVGTLYANCTDADYGQTTLTSPAVATPGKHYPSGYDSW